ncbi:uncharacterized protein [Halyomorpha halys]|uniref:uncharacterized protein n=1 Tax=Halyomorpha halys TaxID=286706 RepID=UPI0006D4D240|nr:uncharacterized protein LOC106685694 [Halyomorpha halys]
MDFTSKIPVEIFHYMFSFLNGDEIFPCLGVSKRWRQIVNTDSIWRPLCSKVRIFDPFPDTADILPLCSWARAYFLCRCVPMYNWRYGIFQSLSIQREESEYFRDAWDGHYAAVFYYTLGTINLYSIYEKIQLIQIIKVPLPKKESYDNASISMNDPYIVAARFNVAVVFKRDSMYSLYKVISVTDTFVFGNFLKNRNVKLGSEIAWECLWMKADTVKDTFLVDLKNDRTQFIPGKPHFAFHDDIKLVVAWTKSSVKVLNTRGDVQLSLGRNKIRGLDFDPKFLVLKVEDDIEIINIKTGDSITMITNPEKEKIEFELSNFLFFLEGKKKSVLSAISPLDGKKIWSVGGLKGRPSDLRMIGSKYIFVVPSYSTRNYCLFDRKGTFIRENHLPDGYDEYPSPLFGETLPFLVITNEENFNIVSFM